MVLAHYVLSDIPPRRISTRMFMVDEATAAAIQRAYATEGEMSAIVELRRHFPGITDDKNARRCVRMIAG